MLPILAAIGISALSTLAGKAASTLLKQHIGGSGLVDSAAGSFATILERSQTTKSNRTVSQAQKVFPAPVTLQPSAFSLQPSVASSGTAYNQIGRHITANGSIVDLRGPIPPMLRYRLPTTASSAQIEVRDLQGTLVKTIELGPQPGGVHELLFDGRGLPPGSYQYKIVANDVMGLPMPRISTTSGHVSGVRYERGRAFLIVGDSLVPPTSVVASHERSASSISWAL